MKYSFFRLFREWIFWVLLFLSAALVIGYSYFYIENSDTFVRSWNYYIDEYSSAEDIDLQIERNQGYIKEFEAELSANGVDPDNRIKDQIELARSSNMILSYLRERVSEYPYKSLQDGTLVSAYTKDARSYTQQAIEVVLLFQLITIILINSQVVSQGRTSGAFVPTFIMRGRKTMFKRQAIISFVVFTLSYLLQVGMIGVIRSLVDQNGSYVLFCDGTNIAIISAGMEFMLTAISVYLILLFYWALFFAISQPLDNVLLYAVVAFVVGAVVFVTAMLADARPINYIHYTLLSSFTDQISMGETVAVIIIRLAAAGGLLWLAYRIAKRRNYSIRCE